MLDKISIFLNLLRFDLWPKMWSILGNVPCKLEKRLYSSAFGWNVLKISVKPISFNVSFKTRVSLLIFCFDDLFNGVNSVQFSHSVVSDSLWPHELQHARLPCPSPTPRVHSNSCPSSRWCHPAISSSVVHFCPQTLPASESFPMSQLFAWGGQSIGVSPLASLLPKNTQDRSPLEWTGWILQFKGLERVFSNTTVQKRQFFGARLSS